MHRAFFGSLILCLPLALFSSSPRVTDVAPQPIHTASTPQTITVSGEDFAPGLTVDMTLPDGGRRHLTPSAVITRREASFQLTATFAAVGTYGLVVQNPDNGASPPFSFKVVEAEDGPVIDMVTPSQATKRSTAQSLKLTGRRFMPGLSASVIDPAGNMATGIEVGDVTDTTVQLRAVLDMEGEYTITITNPSHAASNAVTIQVGTIEGLKICDCQSHW